MSMEKARKMVLKGAELLDDARGLRGHDDWRKTINLEELDLSSTDLCILGQIYGDFNEGLREVKLTWASSEAYGFCSSDDASPRELTLAWEEYLNKSKPTASEVDSIWIRKDDNGTSLLKIVGGLVIVSKKEYWPVIGGHANNTVPTLISKRTLLCDYKPYDPKINFPVGSFLTDKKTKTHIFFVVSEDLTYRMSLNGAAFSYNTGRDSGLPHYVKQYGELIPVKDPINDGDVVI